jgi:myo-inositol 2-dehydrogenase/D-chiro-inositol 1-dehydrogenase
VFVCVAPPCRSLGGACQSNAECCGGKACLADATGQKRDLPLFFFLERYTQSYLDEMREFVDAVLENRDPSVSGNDGLQAVVLGLAARKSVETGRPVCPKEIHGGARA